MWGVLVAMVVTAAPKPASRPVMHPAGELRIALAPAAVPPPTEAVRKLEAQEAGSPLVRLLNGSGPVVLKPEFQGGPGAAIALKF
jgi:hypothetical protein